MTEKTSECSVCGCVKDEQDEICQGCGSLREEPIYDREADLED